MNIFENSKQIQFNNKICEAVYVNGQLIEGNEVECPFPDGYPEVPDIIVNVESFRCNQDGTYKSDSQTVQDACEAINKTGGTLKFPENRPYLVQPKVDPNYITQQRSIGAHYGFMSYDAMFICSRFPIVIDFNNSTIEYKNDENYISLFRYNMLRVQDVPYIVIKNGHIIGDRKFHDYRKEPKVIEFTGADCTKTNAGLLQYNFSQEEWPDYITNVVTGAGPSGANNTKGEEYLKTRFLQVYMKKSTDEDFSIIPYIGFNGDWSNGYNLIVRDNKVTYASGIKFSSAYTPADDTIIRVIRSEPGHEFGGAIYVRNLAPDYILDSEIGKTLTSLNDVKSYMKTNNKAVWWGCLIAVYGYAGTDTLSDKYPKDIPESERVRYFYATNSSQDSIIVYNYDPANTDLVNSYWGVPIGTVIPENSYCLIENMETQDVTADGLYLINGSRKRKNKNAFVVKNCNIHNVRRNGLDISYTDNTFAYNNHIYQVGESDGILGTDPQYGVDIESELNDFTLNKVIMRNNIIENNTRGGITNANTRKETTGSRREEYYLFTGNTIEYPSTTSSNFYPNYIDCNLIVPEKLNSATVVSMITNTNSFINSRITSYATGSRIWGSTKTHVVNSKIFTTDNKIIDYILAGNFENTTFKDIKAGTSQGIDAQGKPINFVGKGISIGYAWNGGYNDAGNKTTYGYAISAKYTNLKGCTFDNCNIFIVDNKTSDIDEFETVLQYLWSSTLNNCIITLSAVYGYGTSVSDEIIAKYKELPGVISVIKV